MCDLELSVDLDFLIKSDANQGFLRSAGEQLLNEAVNAAGDYIGNVINEMMCVKKQAEHPRVLPSLQYMNIVSTLIFQSFRSLPQSGTKKQRVVIGRSITIFLYCLIIMTHKNTQH